ncbi:MAG TPA: hypothetical protein VH209_08930, partial [Steroidobacteraceae bacterium]|nr:hypothetical protein [Steroidobacteraceae bacterium]
MITDSDYHDDFEAYLKRRVSIDRRLALIDRLEPPPELDRIIIGKARAAIQSPAPVAVFKAPGWAVPMGLAATILVSLSMLLDLGMRQAIRQDAGRSQALAAMEEPLTEIALPFDAQPELAESAKASLTRAVAPVENRSPSNSLSRSAARIKAPAVRVPWASLPRAYYIPAPATAPPNEPVVVFLSGSAHHGASGGITEREMAASRLRTAEKPSGSADPMATVIVTASRGHFESQAVASAISITDFPQGGVSGDLASLAASPAAALPNIHMESGSARQSARAGVGSAAERRKHPNPRAWLDYIEKMR